MSPELATEYRRLLSLTQHSLAMRNQNEWAKALQQWMLELSINDPPVDWKQHAERTARALGGMESVGEIALASGDEDLLTLVERLHAACKQILET